MRTQISLSAEQHAMVKQKAAALGVTMAEYIRQLVDRDHERGAVGADVSAIIGIGRSGGSDIAADRVAATADAVEALYEAR